MTTPRPRDSRPTDEEIVTETNAAARGLLSIFAMVVVLAAAIVGVLLWLS
ncbi:MAG TPA: hypothetical protein VEA69_16640 [Tepidisphaeraceae bacterium]|nr:hypothetical protein [Tepidisphaeraceae bacterium]